MSQDDTIPDDFSLNKMFQYSLVQGCYQSDKLMAYTAEHMTLEDLSMPICQVIWEALLSYWQDFGRRASEQELFLIIRDIVTGNTDRYQSMVTPEEREGLAELLNMVTRGQPVNDDFLLSHLPRALRQSRMSRIVEDYDPMNPSGTIHQLLIEDERLESVGNTDKRASLFDHVGLMETDEDCVRISTGCSKMDRLLDGGPAPGDLILVIACSGVGKSNVLTHMCVTAATNYYHSLLLSLELSGDILRRRSFAMLSGVEGAWIKLPVARWPAREQLRKDFVMSDEFLISKYIQIQGLNDRKYHPSEIKRKIIEWKRDVVAAGGSAEDCRMVCVDWLDMLGPMESNSRLNEFTQISNTMKYLKRLAQKQNVVIYTATQAKAEADGKSIVRMKDTALGFHKNDAVDYGIGMGNDEDSQYGMDALDEAEETAEGVIVRTDKHVIWNVYKNRNGSTGPVRIYQAPTLKFYDSKEQYIRHMNDLENPNLSPDVMRALAQQQGLPYSPGGSSGAPGILGA